MSKAVNTILPDGIWTTMLTPFHEDGSIDFRSLERLIDWYIAEGVDGLFAVCQSSEMFFLSSAEKRELAEASVKFSAGRVPVIASGHTADSIKGQIADLQLLADTGVESLVLVTNRLAGEHEGDDVFIKNLGMILDALDPGISLGFYECPYPYKRLLSEDVLKFSLETGRFSFIKDTSCSLEIMKRRLALLKGSSFKLYNANSATLAESLSAGANGYSGVMTNFHPGLYKKIFRGDVHTPCGVDLQNVLGPLSAVENTTYPLNAKVYLQSLGILDSAYTRKLKQAEVDENNYLIVRQMGEFSSALMEA